MNCCAQHTNLPEAAREPLNRGRHNITAVERAGRVVIGVLAAAAGAAGIAGAGSALTIVLFVLLIAAGIDLMVTGISGHCPLYQKLGYTPRSLRSQP